MMDHLKQKQYLISVEFNHAIDHLWMKLSLLIICLFLLIPHGHAEKLDLSLSEHSTQKLKNYLMIQRRGNKFPNKSSYVFTHQMAKTAKLFSRQPAISANFLGSLGLPKTLV
jgi:hypothetical protein